MAFDIKTETEHFLENGFLVVKNAFSTEEVAAFSAELDCTLHNINTIPSASYRTFPWNPDLLERIDPYSPYSNVFAGINNDQRICLRMKSFFGDENCGHFRDKLIFKAPGQAGYRPHQDQSWWHTYGKTTITCLVAIDAANVGNGGLQLLKSSHLSLLTDPKEPRFLTDDDLEKFGRAWCLPELDPGDIVFFHGQMVHKSENNDSNKWRRTYFISYRNQVA